MGYMNQKRINLAFEIILKLLKENAHGREISKYLKVPLSSVQRALSDLEKKNILDFKISGKNKIYFIKKNLCARKYVFSAENYKLLKLIEKYPLLEPIFSEIITVCGSTPIILFGSYAKFNAKKDSDIDVYIETSNKQVKKQIEMIHSTLSVKIGIFNEDSLLIKEIIKNHVIIKGVEQYYEKIRFFE